MKSTIVKLAKKQSVDCIKYVDNNIQLMHLQLDRALNTNEKIIIGTCGSILIGGVSFLLFLHHELKDFKNDQSQELKEFKKDQSQELKEFKRDQFQFFEKFEKKFDEYTKSKKWW